jgi:hypothetical protein
MRRLWEQHLHQKRGRDIGDDVACADRGPVGAD